MTQLIGPTSGIDTRGRQVAERPYGRLLEGDHVTVFQLVMTRRPFIEGMGIILSAFDEARDLYWVRFTGESVPRLRLVHAGSWQNEPDATLHALLAYWQDAHGLESLSPFLAYDAPMPREGQ